MGLEVGISKPCILPESDFVSSANDPSRAVLNDVAVLHEVFPYTPSKRLFSYLVRLCRPLLNHLHSIMFFQRMFLSFQNFQTHLPWRALLRAKRYLRPSPPILLGCLTSSQFTRWYLWLLSVSPQRKRLWIASSFFSTLTGILSTER